ncbi:MAG: ABC transporter permease [Candidatus Wallbacteria bacterium]|nr:ABC transporter permease [Candidatus Wallbacteria bacterium]
MAQRIKLLLSHLQFLRHLVKIDIQLRYHGTFFGFFWTMLNAFAMITIFTFVFGYVLKVPLPRFPVFLFCGYLPWLFFSSCMINSCFSILKSATLVRKIYFPRETLVIAEIVSQFLVYLSSFAVFLLCFSLTGWLNVSWELLPLLPLLFICLFLLSLGFGFLLSLINVFFRDVAYFVEVLITIWFYMSPIFYPLEWVPERVQFLVRTNPITSIIEAFRAIFYGGTYNLWHLWYPGILSVVIFLLGYRIFLLYEQQIVEEL